MAFNKQMLNIMHQLPGKSTSVNNIVLNLHFIRPVKMDILLTSNLAWIVSVFMDLIKFFISIANKGYLNELANEFVGLIRIIFYFKIQ